MNENEVFLQFNKRFPYKDITFCIKADVSEAEGKIKEIEDKMDAEYIGRLNE